MNLIDSVDTILYGRATYQLMAGYWPRASGSFAERTNRLPKLVFTSTLDETPWGDWGNATPVKGALTDEVTKPKDEPGRDVVSYGSGVSSANRRIDGRIQRALRIQTTDPDASVRLWMGIEREPSTRRPGCPCPRTMGSVRLQARRQQPGSRPPRPTVGAIAPGAAFACRRRTPYSISEGQGFLAAPGTQSSDCGRDLRHFGNASLSA